MTTDSKHEENFHDSSVTVLERAKSGDRSASRVLLERLFPSLHRWSRGRIPDYARGPADTEDVVHDACLRVLPRLDRLEYRTIASLRTYLRQSVLNRIRDEIRRVSRRGVGAELHHASLPHHDPSPLEQMILHETSERYLAGLRRLRPTDRQAVICRLEHEYSFEDLATVLGKPSANAARMTVNRALERLAGAMDLKTPPPAAGTARRIDPATR